MSYAEELEAHRELVSKLWEEKKAADAAAREADAIYEAAVQKRFNLEALLRGERPYYVGTKSYSGGDMMGKGGSYSYGKKVVWAKGEPRERDQHYDLGPRYTYAVELEDDLKTFRALVYITDERQPLDIKTKKAILDLPENPEWDEQTKKIHRKWQAELQELKELFT